MWTSTSPVATMVNAASGSAVGVGVGGDGDRDVAGLVGLAGTPAVRDGAWFCVWWAAYAAPPVAPSTTTVATTADSIERGWDRACLTRRE